jgi:hypothetical protein
MERCAVLSRDEPLAGTSPVAARWACLELRGAWPPDVARHPDPAVAAFVKRARDSGYRPLLIRRPGRGHARSKARIYLADTGPLTCATTKLTVTGPGQLADVPLPVAGPLPGVAVADPLLLVCAHGRRDRCCALDGRALALALTAAAEPDVWECSHLGGHRFAPTALVLPTGYLYGRLDVPTAVAVRKAAALGETEPAGCRGRSTWPAQGQVAELAVRRETGLRDADLLTVEGTRVHARDGRAWDVEVQEVTGAPRPSSCGATPLPTTSWQARSIHPL